MWVVDMKRRPCQLAVDRKESGKMEMSLNTKIKSLYRVQVQLICPMTS